MQYYPFGAPRNGTASPERAYTGQQREDGTTTMGHTTTKQRDCRSEPRPRSGDGGAFCRMAMTLTTPDRLRRRLLQPGWVGLSSGIDRTTCSSELGSRWLGAMGCNQALTWRCSTTELF